QGATRGVEHFCVFTIVLRRSQSRITSKNLEYLRRPRNGSRSGVELPVADVADALGLGQALQRPCELALGSLAVGDIESGADDPQRPCGLFIQEDLSRLLQPSDFPIGAHEAVQAGITAALTNGSGDRPADLGVLLHGDHAEEELIAYRHGPGCI